MKKQLSWTQKFIIGWCIGFTLSCGLIILMFYLLFISSARADTVSVYTTKDGITLYDVEKNNDDFSVHDLNTGEIHSSYGNIIDKKALKYYDYRKKKKKGDVLYDYGSEDYLFIDE